MKNTFRAVCLLLSLLLCAPFALADPVQKKASPLRVVALKSRTTVEGCQDYIWVEIKGGSAIDRSEMLGEVAVKFADESIARADGRIDSEGFLNILAGKPGTTIATFTCESLNGSRAIAKCKIIVKSNQYSQSKPTVGKAAGLYLSAKTMFYEDSVLFMDVFVYNKTGKPIKQIQGMRIIATPSNGGTPSSVLVGDWTPAGGVLKNKKFAVVRVNFGAQTNTTVVRTKKPVYALSLAAGEIVN